VAGLDPAVERAILACLEKEPRRRPASALVVSAMLTGSDPLEAAIAAGETPSPDLVAAAGEIEGLRPAAAWSLAAVILVGLALVPLAGRSFRLLDRVPTGKPPAVLEDRARDLVRRVAGSEPAIDDAWGLSVDWGYLGHVAERDSSPARWDVLATGHPPVLQFWYRESPRPLVSLLPSGKVYSGKPGLEASGMTGVHYDVEGNLLRFYAVPPQLERESPASASPPDWSPLFAEARLDPGSFRPVEPRWSPPFFADARAAWEGTWPERPDLPVRIEAAAWRGKPVWFDVVWPWTKPERMEKYAWPASKLLRQAVFIATVLLLVGAAGLMARRNVVIGRGDRRGAFRVAMVLAVLGFVAWVLSAHHVADWNTQVGLVARGAGSVVLEAALVWLFYLAVEPYARRLRPWTLVSWTRLLGGGLGDPVVGRDSLVGFCWAVLVFFLLPLTHVLPPLFGEPPPEPMSGYTDPLAGSGRLMGSILQMAGESILAGMGVLLLFVLARLLLRRDSLAAVAVTLAVAVTAGATGGPAAWFVVPAVALWTVTWIVLLLRFGLLSAIVGLFAYDLLTIFPLTAELSAWTAGPTLVILPLLAILAVLALRHALGGTGLRRYVAGEASSRP
jgi:serine/threonine-protein kinase